jgi:predicted transcriptional regulator
MARRPSPNPTEVELQILRVLWQRGPSTVRDVHEALASERDTGYSTTLKMMQVMTEKGLLLKDDRQRPQVYRPALSQDAAQTRFVDDLILRVFGGAADQLILRAVASRHVSRKDRQRIRELLGKLEDDARKRDRDVRKDERDSTPRAKDVKQTEGDAP